MGVVLPSWAWYFLCGSVISSAYVFFMSVGVVFHLCAWFNLCRRVYYL